MREVLAEDSLNEAAFIQLIRVYCQDLKNRRGAQRLVAGAADTFSPKLLAYLNLTLDEWIQMPTRSMVQHRGWLAWLLPPNPSQLQPQKLAITPPPITQKPRSTIRLGSRMRKAQTRFKKWWKQNATHQNHF